MQTQFKNYLFFILIWSGFSVFAQNRLVDSLKKVLDNTAHDTLRVQLLNDMGGHLLNGGQFIEAEAYLNNARKLAEEVGYKRGLATAYGRIGILYMDKNDYPFANENYSKALKLNEELGDKKGIADVISNMGIAYSDQGEYAKALEKYFAALKIREEVGDIESTSISMMSIANIYFLQNEFKTALDYYLNIANSKGIEKRKFFLGQVLNNVGLAYMQLKDPVKALEYFEKAMKMEEEINDRLGIAISLTNIGSVYSTQKNYSKAIELVSKGCDMFIESGDKKGEVEAYFELGNIYDSIKQPQKAMEYFNKQLKLAKEINSRINIKLAYKSISEHYRKQNNYKEALFYYDQYKLLEDSIQSESNLKTIAELEAKYNTHKKEKEIELLKKEQQISDAENARQKQLIFSGIVLLILIGIAGFFFYNSNQLKKKAALERKNFELERNALSAQMNPHFIFNSLGTIGGFIADNEKEKAVEYLGIFSRLIRHNLEQSREQMVTVVDEAQMLRSYLHLQQLRFDNKFSYEIDIEANMDDAITIPPMFIQPFVENSILHGINPKGGNGLIKVKFYVKDDKRLICEVKDNGIGRSESLKRKTVFDEAHRSLATTITEERMEMINSKNKEKIEIRIEDILDEKNVVCGTKVLLSFPIEYLS
jgi:tetratricopeptide (TPR) repeat protein